jgi:hypothetical protein
MLKKKKLWLKYRKFSEIRREKHRKQAIMGLVVKLVLDNNYYYYTDSTRNSINKRGSQIRHLTIMQVYIQAWD